MEREWFIFYRSFYEAINELPDENKLVLYWAIAEYSFTLQEPKLEWLNKTIWVLIKPQLEANNRRFINGKKWAKKKQEQSKTKAKEKQNESKSKPKEKEKEKENVKDKEIVSKETKELAPIKKQITEDIDNLILELKSVCDEYWLAYDKTKERMFAKHILTANDYGEFAEKVWLDRVRLAKNTIVLSQKWFKTLSWPMSIYQEYARCFNDCKNKVQKKEKVILDIPEEDIF